MYIFLKWILIRNITWSVLCRGNNDKSYAMRLVQHSVLSRTQVPFRLTAIAFTLQLLHDRREMLIKGVQ